MVESEDGDVKALQTVRPDRAGVVHLVQNKGTGVSLSDTPTMCSNAERR